MTFKETELLRTEMRKSVLYLEYGSGQSTRFATECANVKAICSIESDPKFVETYFEGDAAIAEARKAERLLFRFIHLGPTREWGFPRNRAHIHLWPNYALAPYAQNFKWDLVLVDGRFRVACVLLAALEGPAEGVILVHDFSMRSEYKGMLRFMEIAEQVDTLVKLRRRADFDVRKAQEALRSYLYAADDRVGFARFCYLIGAFRERVTAKFR